MCNFYVPPQQSIARAFTVVGFRWREILRAGSFSTVGLANFGSAALLSFRTLLGPLFVVRSLSAAGASTTDAADLLEAWLSTTSPVCFPFLATNHVNSNSMDVHILRTVR